MRAPAWRRGVVAFPIRVLMVSALTTVIVGASAAIASASWASYRFVTVNDPLSSYRYAWAGGDYGSHQLAFARLQTLPTFGAWQIGLYDLRLDSFDPLPIQSGAVSPVVSGSKILYSFDRQLWVYDKQAGGYQPVPDSGQAYYPDISGDKVVWWRSADRVVRYWDGSTSVEATFGVDAGAATISGDRIAFAQREGPADVVYVIKTDGSVVATEATRWSASYVRIDGSMVVWTDTDGVNADLKYMELGDLVVHTVPDSGGSEFEGFFAGDKIVFRERADGVNDAIMLWDTRLKVKAVLVPAPSDMYIDAAWDGHAMLESFSDPRAIAVADIAEPDIPFNASPSLGSYGYRPSITGRITDMGIPLASVALSVERSTDRLAWTPVAWGASDSSGAFSIGLPAQTTACYLRVVYGGQLSADPTIPLHLSKATDPLPVQVRAKLGLPYAPAVTRTSSSFRSYGSIAPAQPAATKTWIDCYRLENGRYRLRRSYLGWATGSAYSGSGVKLPLAGAWRICARFAGNDTSASSSSVFRYVTVR